LTISLPSNKLYILGLIRNRESLLSHLKELNKQKPRTKTDENLLAEISRLESLLTVQRDDLVRCFHIVSTHASLMMISDCL
jgi:hypothetical protein